MTFLYKKKPPSLCYTLFFIQLLSAAQPNTEQPYVEWLTIVDKIFKIGSIITYLDGPEQFEVIELQKSGTDNEDAEVIHLVCRPYPCPEDYYTLIIFNAEHATLVQQSN